jgi:hypothetical protein
VTKSAPADHRFDVNPPRRELKVSLAGYKDDTMIPKPAPVADSKPTIDTAPLVLSARILCWLLFPAVPGVLPGA